MRSDRGDVPGTGQDAAESGVAARLLYDETWAIWSMWQPSSAGHERHCTP